MSVGLKSFSSFINFNCSTVNATQDKISLKGTNIVSNVHNQVDEEVLVCNSTIVVANKNTVTEIGFNVDVTSDVRFVKLHFSLRGNYLHSCTNTTNFKVNVPEGCCNMFFVPVLPTVETYTGRHHKTLEVYITPQELAKIVGAEFGTDLKQFFSKITALEPAAYYKKSKQIPLKFKNQINEILQCKYTGSLKDNYLKSRLVVLLIDFLMKTAKPVAEEAIIAEQDYLALVKVEAYCNQNLKKKLTINHLSLIAGFNTTKLKRDFKKVYKTTIFKHITQLRMQKAKELIQEKGLSIAEVSYEVGYSNPQHFTAAFKKTIGYLPSKLIK
ncbi:AraC family transcriptional regulator [Cellulophaga lytica]|uniref:helix-turn-helix domain-containing protein n=1 Tax=Cellulophaga lytica TaxID=979 RepID=UPI0026E236A0|nr:AraC family transcriptional regulator [Cellulophaga lytica]MDO6853540.1 AraC family transcriptional regulator [Cellulophaga lytica]